MGEGRRVKGREQERFFSKDDITMYNKGRQGALKPKNNLNFEYKITLATDLEGKEQFQESTTAKFTFHI